MTIKTLKNFASMNQSFKDWLTTCPEEYIWQINEVTEDLEGTFILMVLMPGKNKIGLEK